MVVLWREMDLAQNLSISNKIPTACKAIIHGLVVLGWSMDLAENWHAESYIPIYCLTKYQIH